MFAWLQERRGEDREQPAQPRSLLALGDPVPPPLELSNPAAPQPPDHGLLVRVVQPGSNAADAGIQPGDVLLRYDGSKLANLGELQKRVQAADPKVAGIAVAVWRQGETLNLTLRPGRLGVELETRPAAEAILAQREGDDLLRRTRGSAFGRLPARAARSRPSLRCSTARTSSSAPTPANNSWLTCRPTVSSPNSR